MNSSSCINTAILVDGAFFIKRYRSLFNGYDHPPQLVVETMYSNLMSHLYSSKGKGDTNPRTCDLYRIFFYDCPPLTKKAHNPISGKAIDFSKSREAEFRLGLHEALKRKRKVALRLGHLDEDNVNWVIHPEQTKALLKNKLTVEELRPENVRYEARQKGVDMKIAVDIASLAFKRQVQQIVLVAGDSDFVPAAKLARREGIDFILDPMWNPIRPDLHEHIDGLRSTWPRPRKQKPILA